MALVNFEVVISIISGIILGLSFISGAAIAIHLKLSLLIKSNIITFNGQTNFLSY
ncbi:MAG TPA: hypothetical protein VFV86_05930 [Nitrososphaeraceae archaeon]|nr:hypothetical protein [Nitrososphaeraceae archaeon]